MSSDRAPQVSGLPNRSLPRRPVVPPPARRLPAHGFTLIELMVVLVIIAIVAAFTYGSLFRSKTTNRLLATEQVIADMIRQARHTARTSGGPVTLLFRKDRREIAGVSRVPLWSEDFENRSSFNDSSYQQGQTGNGLNCDLPEFAGKTFDLEKHHQLRKTPASGRNEGFYLVGAIRPPLAGGNGVNALIPLLVVGSDDSLDGSVAGIVLRKIIREEQDNAPFVNQGGSTQSGTGGSTSAPPNPNLVCWDIIGWVRPTGSDWASTIDATGVSSLFDKPADISRDNPLLHLTEQSKGTDSLDVSAPMAGDRWEELGLLYDGERLELYRNGQRVGERVVAGLKLDDATKVAVGSAKGGGGGGSSLAQGTIDNCRLYRLATDQPGLLPQGVTADKDYRIVAHPDGRVEVDAASRIPAAAGVGGGGNANLIALNQPTVLTFYGDFAKQSNNARDKATITVYVDGHITSALDISATK